MMRMSRKKKEGCLFDKCEPYWLNGAEAYLHTYRDFVSAGYERWRLETTSILIGHRCIFLKIKFVRYCQFWDNSILVWELGMLL